jgi:hypothetical protein
MFRMQRESVKHYFNNMSKEGEHVVAMNIRRSPALPVQIGNEEVNYCLHERIVTLKTI